MKRSYVWLVGLLTLLFVGSVWASEEDVIKTIINARSKVKEFALPSSQIPGLSIDKAYELQKKLVKELISKGDSIRGFKAGLTADALQKRFGVPSPVMGPLFKSGELGPEAVVDRRDFVRLFVETEVGYIFGEKISRPVGSTDDLKKMVKEIFPAVELPDIRFADMKELKGADLVVDAVSSAKYIVGKKIPAYGFDVNTIQVTLKLDGNVINQGKAQDVLGDQWKGLLWLVNEVTSRGWEIEPGQILITGAMGSMLPGKPGKYEGDWGALGSISWTIK